jgi:hypothetical protein
LFRTGFDGGFARFNLAGQVRPGTALFFKAARWIAAQKMRSNGQAMWSDSGVEWEIFMRMDFQCKRQRRLCWSGRRTARAISHVVRTE